MDSTEIPVYRQQEQSAYNGHFESTCYHALLLFNRGDCLAAKLGPGNVHSAEDWEALILMLPEIERQTEARQRGGLCATLNRWEALTRFLEDGDLEIDNCTTERANRDIAFGSWELDVSRQRRGR
jgi:hypothetical protein